MKEAYLYDSGTHLLVFESAESAAKTAIKTLDKFTEDRLCKKELLTNIDGLRIQEVDSFRLPSITGFLTQMRVGGRLILNACSMDSTGTSTVKIEKLSVIKEEFNAKVH